MGGEPPQIRQARKGGWRWLHPARLGGEWVTARYTEWKGVQSKEEAKSWAARFVLSSMRVESPLSWVFKKRNLPPHTTVYYCLLDFFAFFVFFLKTYLFIWRRGAEVERQSWSRFSTECRAQCGAPSQDPEPKPTVGYLTNSATKAPQLLSPFLRSELTWVCSSKQKETHKFSKPRWDPGQRLFYHYFLLLYNQKLSITKKIWGHSATNISLPTDCSYLFFFQLPHGWA